MGGNTKIQGFDNRIRAELKMMCATDTIINVVKTYD